MVLTLVGRDGRVLCARCRLADTPIARIKGLLGRRELATQALDLMESRKITALLVTDVDGRIEGVLHLHDLWKTEMI